MACGCGKKKQAALARRGFTASADTADKTQPQVTRPAVWTGKPKEAK